MCRRVDLVCAVTEPLRATLAERGIDSRLLRHGFAAELAPRSTARTRPPGSRPCPVRWWATSAASTTGSTSRRSPPPRIACARGRSCSSAPVSPRLAPASGGARLAPNLVVLGAQPRDAVPAHLAALDCALLPYREDAWGAHGSPLKLWEYLYAGCPIVASGYEVLREYGAFVDYVAPADLPEAAARALDGRRPEDRAQRRAHALANTWDDRAAELLRMAAPM